MLLSIETNRKIIEEDKYEIQRLKNEVKRLERKSAREGKHRKDKERDSFQSKIRGKRDT